MTLDKAISELTALEAWYSGQADEDGDEAIKIGIEALKEIKLIRQSWEACKTIVINNFYPLLPGETEE